MWYVSYINHSSQSNISNSKKGGIYFYWNLALHKLVMFLSTDKCWHPLSKSSTNFSSSCRLSEFWSLCLIDWEVHVHYTTHHTWATSGQQPTLSLTDTLDMSSPLSALTDWQRCRLSLRHCQSWGGCPTSQHHHHLSTPLAGHIQAPRFTIFFPK